MKRVIAMKLNETIAEARKRKGLTQEQLAQKLYVTRQAVSRWERGEVVPGIDMLKLIAITLEEPIVHLLDMPEHYCESCGMMLSPDEYGTDSDGAKTDHYCKWCFEQGKYTYETSMEAMIEDCAPRLAENTGMTNDEAVSLMGAVLPHLQNIILKRFVYRTRNGDVESWMTSYAERHWDRTVIRNTKRLGQRSFANQ